MIQNKSINIITSFSRAGYYLYGKNFIKFFHTFFPKHIGLHIYIEDNAPLPIIKDLGLINCNVYNLLDVSENCNSFLKRHERNGYVRGTAKYKTHAWKQKCLDQQYNYRFDAYKFCRKPFAIQHAAQTIDDGLLFWIDADVITFKKIPDELFYALMPQNKKCCFLYRKSAYSECGFIGYDLDEKKARDLLNGVAETYHNDMFMNYSEWHDSYIWDLVRKAIMIPDDWYAIPSNFDSNPWDSSVLSEYMLHMKGNRKDTAMQEWQIKMIKTHGGDVYEKIGAILAAG